MIKKITKLSDQKENRKEELTVYRKIKQSMALNENNYYGINY